MAVKESEESAGVSSSMRTTLIVCRRTGVAMISASILLTAYMALMNSRYELVPVVSLLVGSGAGLITGVSFAKSWQAQSENTMRGEDEK